MRDGENTEISIRKQRECHGKKVLGPVENEGENVIQIYKIKGIDK